MRGFRCAAPVVRHRRFVRRPILLSPLWGLLSMTSGGSSCAAFAVQSYWTESTSSRAWEFKIVDKYPSLVEAASPTTLLEHLLSNQAFPTASQARRAIERGEILVLPNGFAFDPHFCYNNDPLIEPSMNLSSDDQIYRVTRLPNERCYPMEATKFVYPPATLQSLSVNEMVVYEDSEMAVLNKPEGMTTIDAPPNSKRDDLQSLLPFVLHPPPSFTTTSSTFKKPVLPRPVHRLDRATSGLVLVSKTTPSMQRLSALFRQRQIHKTYTAVVFRTPSEEDKGVIDYPIDGKEAVTEWQVAETNGEFSRLQLHPQTGRFHQLRRHLAYCLGTPIVGDPKYDLVGTKDDETASFRRSFRSRGLHLCCNRLEFDLDNAGDHESYRTGAKSCYSIVDHDNDAGKVTMTVSIDLPNKMFHFFKA